MPIDILIVGQLPPPFHGSNAMNERFFVSLKKIGHRVFMVEKTFSRKMDEVGKTSIIKLFRLPMVAFKLLCKIISKKPKLCFYFLTVKPPSIYVDMLFLTLIRLLGVEVVLYLHGKGLHKINESSNRIFKTLGKRVISNSLGAMVLGELLKNDINMFIPDERLFVLPNCIPDTSAEMHSSKYKEKDDRFVQILYLSNLVPSKGPMEFLKAAKRIVACSDCVKFVLAGPYLDMSFHKEIQKFIVDEDLKGYIDMPGAVYGDEKEDLFRESDIFIYPTYFDLEAFPLVNIEAMRAGLPIVSTNEGSIPEAVIDGLNGYIVDPKNIEQIADRALKLINDKNLRNKMGIAGRNIYEKSFAVDIYEKKLKDAISFFIELNECR